MSELRNKALKQRKKFSRDLSFCVINHDDNLNRNECHQPNILLTRLSANTPDHLMHFLGQQMD